MSSRGALGGLFAGIILWGLTACGGSGDVADSGGTGGTGFTTAVVSSGPISAIGSIWVNGVEYDTTGATLILPGGSTAIDSQGTAGGTLLHAGMLVTVTGELAADGVSGQARQVSYSRSLVGQVEAVAAGRYTVLGQQVTVAAGAAPTRFQPVGWTPAVGEWVEVSGYALTDGSVRASYLAQVQAAGEVELTGPITAINGDGSLMLNGVTRVVLPTGQSAATLVVGMVVEVEGYWTGGVLTAHHLEIEHSVLADQEGHEAELSGVVVQRLSATEFTLAGMQVRVDGATRYEGGGAADIVPGVLLEVEGTLGADGVLLAREVEFEEMPGGAAGADQPEGHDAEGGEDDDDD